MHKLKDKFILIVDDEPELLELLGEEFLSLGAKVILAESGNKALEILKKQAIDVVVSDVRMPDGTGIFLLESMKALRLEIPMVMLMTGNLEFDIYDAYDLGADAVFPKPYNPQVLVDTVARTLVPTKEKFVAREFARSKADFKVKIQSKNRDNPSGSILNIGKGGMFIAFRNQIPNVGDLIQFEFDDQKLKLTGTAVCRWCRKKNERGLPIGGGFEFEELSSESIASLEAYLRERKITAYIPKE